MAFFPMFVDLTGKDCLVVGGGTVALRKVMLLLDFEAKVYVVSPKCCRELVELAKQNEKVQIRYRTFEEADLTDKELVIAATDDISCNQRISRLCKEGRIPVNVVDTKKECTFIVPSYNKQGSVVAAFSSGGNAPVLTQYLKEKGAEYVTPRLGEISDFLGTIRPYVKEHFHTEGERKKAYRNILEDLLLREDFPDMEEVESILRDVEN